MFFVFSNLRLKLGRSGDLVSFRGAVAPRMAQGDDFPLPKHSFSLKKSPQREKKSLFSRKNIGKFCPRARKIPPNLIFMVVLTDEAEIIAIQVRRSI